VRGVVRDERGQPVEGAALAIGGEVVFTNSAGEFFVRVRSPRRYDLSVRLEEFLFPGRWDVVSAPAQCRAQAEAAAASTEIILRRAAAVPPAPSPAPAASQSPAAPAPQAADTLYRNDR
jgi:hypothetical protein